MKYAWIEESKIRDICQGGDPTIHYHPDVAVFYDTQVPDDAQNGDGWANGQVVKSVVQAPTPAPILWTVKDAREKLTLLERVKWDNDKADTIKTAKIEFEQPKGRAQTKEILDMLVAAGDISQISADLILSKTNEINTTIPTTVV
jgi:hypothetical protein